MYCSNCGKEMQEDNQFCPYCGTKIKVQYAQKSKPVNTKNKKIALWVCAIIIIAFAIANIVFIINDAKAEREKDLQTLDNMQNAVSFNCPNCQKWISTNKKNLGELYNSYTYICPNCNKFLTINKDTLIVTYQK